MSILIDIDGSTEEFEGDEISTDWPPANGTDPVSLTNSTVLPQLTVNPGDIILANQGTEYVYTQVDPTSGAVIATITFGAINNGDGTFTYAPSQGLSTGTIPVSLSGTTVPYATTPSDILYGQPDGPTTASAANTSSYSGPYASIAPTNSLDLGQDEVDWGVEVIATVDTQKDPHSGKYKVHMRSGVSETTGLDLATNAVGRTHKHHHNWETGHMTDTKIHSILVGSATALFLEPNISNSPGGTNIPKYLPDGTLPSPVNNSNAVPLGAWNGNTFNPINKTANNCLIEGIASPVPAGATPLYQSQWPPTGPASAIILLDLLTGATSGTANPTWWTAPGGTDITTDAFITKIKVGAMSSTVDPGTGMYIFHPTMGTVSGVGASGSQTVGPGSITREYDYNSADRFHFDNFSLGFRLAQVDDAHARWQSPLLLRSAYHGWFDTVDIVLDAAEALIDPTPIFMWIDPTAQEQSFTVLNPVNSSTGSFTAREHYHLVFNKSSSYIDISHNVTADRVKAPGDTSPVTINGKNYQPWVATNGSPLSTATDTVEPGFFRCLYYPPNVNDNPAAKDLMYLGVISNKPDKNGYLFLKGWHVQNQIMPDNPPANFATKESVFPTDNQRWRHRGFYFATGVPQDTTSTDPTTKRYYYTSPVYVVPEVDVHVVSGSTVYTKLTPLMEIYDPKALLYDPTAEHAVVPTTSTGGLEDPPNVGQTFPYRLMDGGVFANHVVQLVANAVSDPTANPPLGNYPPAFWARAGWHVVYNISNKAITLSQPNTTMDGSGNIIANTGSNVSIAPYSFASVKYIPDKQGKYLMYIGHWSYKPDAKGFLFIVGSKHGIGLTNPSRSGSGTVTEEVDRPKRSYNWLFQNFDLAFPPQSGQTTVTVTAILESGTGSYPIILFKDTNTTQVVNNLTATTGFLVGAGDHIYYNKAGSTFNLPFGYTTREGATTIAAYAMNAVTGTIVTGAGASGNQGNTGDAGHIIEDPNLVHIGRVSNQVDAAGYLYIRGWSHGNLVNPDHVPANLFKQENLYLHDQGRWRHVGFHLEIDYGGTTSPYTSNVRIVPDEKGTHSPVLEFYDPTISITTATSVAPYGTVYPYAVTTDNIYDVGGITNYPALLYDTSISAANNTFQVAEKIANTSFTAKCKYNLVYNFSGSTVTLIGGNVTATGSTTIAPFTMAATKWPTTNPNLIKMGHFSYKPDKNGFLFLVGSKHGLVTTSQALIAGSGTNGITTTDEQDRPKKIGNWLFTNFHLDFSSASPGYSVVTFPFDGTASGSRAVHFKDTNTTVGVSNTQFLAYVSYHVYFNKSNNTIVQNSTSPSGTAMPSFTTGDGTFNSGDANAHQIPGQYIMATNVFLTDPDLIHIGQISPSPDTQGYLFIKGWTHNSAALSGDLLKTVPNEKLNPSNPTRWMLKGVTMRHTTSGGSISVPNTEPQYLSWGDYPTSPTSTGLEGSAIGADGSLIGNVTNNLLTIRRNDLVFWNSGSTSVGPWGSYPAVSAGGIGVAPDGTNISIPQLFWIGKVKSAFDSKSGLLGIEGFHVGLHQIGSDSVQPGSLPTSVFHPTVTANFILKNVDFVQSVSGGTQYIAWTGGSATLLDGSTPPNSSGVVNNSSGANSSALGTNNFLYANGSLFWTATSGNISSYNGSPIISNDIYPIAHVGTDTDSTTGLLKIYPYTTQVPIGRDLHQNNSIPDSVVRNTTNLSAFTSTYTVPTASSGQPVVWSGVTPGTGSLSTGDGPGNMSSPGTITPTNGQGNVYWRLFDSTASHYSPWYNLRPFYKDLSGLYVNNPGYTNYDFQSAAIQSCMIQGADLYSGYPVALVPVEFRAFSDTSINFKFVVLQMPYLTSAPNYYVEIRWSISVSAT